MGWLLRCPFGPNHYSAVMSGSFFERRRRRLPGRVPPSDAGQGGASNENAEVAVCPDAALRYAAAAAPRLVSWSRAGVTDPREWHALAHRKLVELTGHGRFGGPPGIVGRRDLGERDGLRHQSLYVRIRHGNDIPVRIVHAPDASAAGPRAAVICLQDDRWGMHVSWGEARSEAERAAVSDGFDIARQAARCGHYAVCVELPGVGERVPKTDDGAAAVADATTAHGLVLGRCPPGDRACDVSSVLNWILDGDFGHPLGTAVVPVVGIGAGGFAGLLAAAIDTRLAGVAAIDCVGSLRVAIAARSLPFGYVVPGLLRWMDVEDVTALCAPRPVLLMSGRDHPRWPAAEAAQVAQYAGDLYGRFDAGDALFMEAVDGPFGLDTETLWRWLGRAVAVTDAASSGQDAGGVPRRRETRPRAR